MSTMHDAEMNDTHTSKTPKLDEDKIVITMACIKYSAEDAEKEIESVKSLLAQEGISNANIEVKEIFSDFFTKITLYDIESELAKKIQSLLADEGYLEWTSFTAKYDKKTVYLSGIPNDICTRDLLYKEIKHIRSVFQYLEVTKPKTITENSRFRGKIVCSEEEDKAVFLSVKFISVRGKLIFFTEKSLTPVKTWILSGLPPQSTEFNVFLLLPKIREQIISCQVDSTTRRAFINFRDETYIPPPVENLRWSIKGVKTCHSCNYELPKHHEMCKHHIDNKCYVPEEPIKSKKPVSSSRKRGLN